VTKQNKFVPLHAMRTWVDPL